MRKWNANRHGDDRLSGFAIPRPARIESLELRRLLAAVSFDGDGDGVSWNDPFNWSNNAVPTGDADVTLPAGGTVNLAAKGAHIKSFSSAGALTISGASLIIDNTATIGAATTIQAGGALTLGGTIAINATLTLGNASDNSSGVLVVSGAANQTLGGTGSITAVGNATSIILNNTFDGVGSGLQMTIAGGFGVSGKNLAIYPNNAGGTIVNNGALSANVAGGNWNINALVPAGPFTNNGSISVASGATASVAESLINTGTLSIGGRLLVEAQLSIQAGSMNSLLPGGAALLKTGGLAMAAGTILDVSDNAMVIGGDNAGSWNGSAYTGITGLVASGYHGGDWAGTGIITSQGNAKNVLTTLVALSGADAGYVSSTFRGVSVTESDTIVMYTWGGDSNLDGTLDSGDYFGINSHVVNSGSAFGYQNGDFNYDGEINGDDYFVIDSNIVYAMNSPDFPTDTATFRWVRESDPEDDLW